MTIALALFVLCPLLLAAVLACFKRYSYSANSILFSVMVLCFWGGGWFTGKTSVKLDPFFVFGVKRTLQEDITIVRIHQRTLYFSNGESFYSPNSWLISLYDIFSFVFAAGLIMLAARFVAFFLAKRMSPQLYDCLSHKWTIGKTVKDQGH